MKAPAKIVLTLVVLIPVIIIAAVAYLYLNLNSIIKDGVETMGPKVTQTTVKLGSSNISIFDGEGELSDLVIGNPKGFQSKSAFTLDSIKMAVDKESLTKDVIVVKSINISGPKITLEVSNKSNNIKTIRKNVSQFTASHGGGKGSQAAGSAKGSDIKLIIEDVLITGGEVKIVAPAIKQEASSNLPDIHMKAIGKDKNGVTVGEASLIIMEEVEKTVMQSSANPLKDLRTKFDVPLDGKEAELTDQIKQKASDLTEGIKGMFK
jgi:uncharacterized protein involved in outer membrane biogenesis